MGGKKYNFIALIFTSNQMNEKATFAQSNMGLLFYEWFMHEYHMMKIILLMFEMFAIKQTMLLLPTFQLT